MLVKVRGKGIKLNGKWYYKNEEATIDEKEWKENKDYLDIIKDEETEKLPQVPGKNDEDDKEELLKLREKGKELGIKNAHFMGKEKLEKLIAEKEVDKAEENGKEAENFENGNDTNAGNNEESNSLE